MAQRITKEDGREYYRMEIAGCTRDLPLCPISDTTDIAGFVMFGDVEVTERAAEELLKRCPEHDVVVTAESKGIPLCYEMARQGCRRYVVARKGIKAYMRNPIHVEVKSITTDHVQKLYLAEEDRLAMEGKRVLIVDDVISTGESLEAMEALVERFGGNIVGRGRRGKPEGYYLFGAPSPVPPVTGGKRSDR